MSLFIFFKDLLSRFKSSDTNAKDVFDHYFFDLKYYLNKDASVEQFAHLLNYKSEKLDRIAITYYGNEFDLLINEYRYKHFLREFESPYNKDSGFDSNENFVEYVKEMQEKSNKH